MRVALAVLAFLAPTLAAAQQVTGDVQGRVLGLGGQPVAAVRVTVAGPGLQGDRATVSDLRGGFRLLGLPPGPYTIRLTGIGYRPLVIEQVTVRLGGTTSVGEIRLEAQAVELAAIVVSGANPVIDPVSAASRTTLDSSQFLSLPSDRDFRSLAALLPQANISPFSTGSAYDADGINIAGSTGLDNAFYVDGTNVTVGTGNGIELPYNFVQEIQVTTGGYEAEVGRATSGIINAITSSGGNDFHGQVFGFFTAEELSTAARAGPGTARPVHFAQYDVGLSVGGRLRRDRLWYFAAYDEKSLNQDASIAAIPRQQDTQTHHLVAGKLTWRAGPATDVALTVLGDPYTHDRLTGVLPLTTDPVPAQGRERGGGWTLSLEARHDVSPQVQFSVAASRLAHHLDTGLRSGATSLEAVTRIDDQTTSISSGGVGIFDNGRESRNAIRLAVRLLAPGHAAKFGIEFEDNFYADSGWFSLVTRTASNVYDWEQSYGYSRLHNRVPTVYAQDAWELSPRLRISAGVRWEAQYLTGQVGPPRTIPSELAPRLGVVYQPGVLGSQRLFASAGRFYEQFYPQSLIFWNSVGFNSGATYPQNPLVDSSSGVQSGRDSTLIPATNNLVGQSYDAVVVGYERRLGSAFKIGVTATDRWLRWVLEDGHPPGDSVNRMGNPGRGPLATMPRARQHYMAAAVWLERATGGPLYLSGSYVLSRNVGNYTGLYSGDYMYGMPNSFLPYNYPDQMIDASGLLPNDRTHVAKVAASYRFGARATLGAFLSVASGTPLSEYGASAYDPFNLTFVRPRGSAGRTPAIWSLDLHGACALPVARHGRVRPRLLLDVFNVGSPRKALLYDQRHYFDAARTLVNPDYGVVKRYQPPMSARVGMVVDF